MAVLETLVYSTLTGNSSVAAIVSTRVYPLILPQGCDLPAITYERISTEYISTLSGFAGMERVRMQIDVLAESYSAAKSLSASVITAMDRSLLFKCLVDSCQDTVADVDGIYMSSIDFLVWNAP